MARRQYRMGKRAATAAETRQRLVEATFELHTEQGIATTTMKQIAERADVSVGTAYHHFPTYDEAIRACGAYTLDRFRFPEEADFIKPGMTLGERLTGLAEAYFGYYERLPAWEHVRRDQEKIPVLREFVEFEESHRRHLTAVALAPDVVQPAIAATVSVLLDLPVFLGLKRIGLDRDAAVGRITEIALAWIAGFQPDAGKGVQSDENQS